MNILIVTDQLGQAEEIEEFLTVHCQVTVENTDDPQRVALRIKELQPEVIILDSKMAEDQGMAILQIVREKNLLRTIPVFIVTEIKHRATLPKAVRLGINECFLKPVNLNRLLECINKWAPLAKMDKSPPANENPAVVPVPNAHNCQEQDDNATLAEARKIIAKMMASEKLQMPVLPEIALEVQKRVQNPEAGVDEIVELIKSDVAISSKILRVANSSHYGGNDNIQDLNLAVGRIGLREIQSIVQILCGQQLFNVSHPKIKQLMQKLWEHSLSCAYAAQLLAQTIAMKDSELYFLLGLTHDLGKVFLVQLIAKALEQDPAREQVFSDHIISALLKLMHNQVGALIITKWNYPAIFIEIAHHHNDSVEQACASLPLAATYYSNLLTRKLGYSLDSFDSQQDNLEKAASYLKLTPDQSQEFETVLGDTIHKIKGSFFGLAA